MPNTVIFDGSEVSPSKVVCVGRNYVDHINELGNSIPDEPVIFIKPNSAISSEIYTGEHDSLNYEGEISFLIDNGSLAGVGFGLDLTKRQIQSALKEKGLPWERAKAFDGSAVFSEFVRFNGDVSNLRIELHINGQLRQSSGCQFMINTPAALLEEVATFMTLENNDVLMSGTPSGVGPVNHGDEFIGRIFSAEELLIEQFWRVKKHNE